MAGSYDNIEQRLVEAIHGVGVKCKGQPNGVWTRTLKADLWTLGEALGFTTCATDCDENEWLFDLCWYAGPTECFTTFPLVLESEWQNSWDGDREKYYRKIRYDFQKLLLARADHRVMVFEQLDETAFEDVVVRLSGCIEAFRDTAKGDRYLFACWLMGSRQEFAFRQYIA